MPAIKAKSAASITRWAPALAWMAFIFYLSSLPDVPGPQIVSWQPYLAHFLLYAVLGIALRRAVPQRSHAAVILLGSLYGLGDEIHQRFVPPRTASAADLLVDIAGVVCGALLWSRARRQD